MNVENCALYIICSNIQIMIIMTLIFILLLILVAVAIIFIIIAIIFILVCYFLLILFRYRLFFTFILILYVYYRWWNDNGGRRRDCLSLAVVAMDVAARTWACSASSRARATVAC